MFVNFISDVLPLLFILVVSLVREGSEDIARAREDERVNMQMVDVWRSSQGG